MLSRATLQLLEPALGVTLQGAVVAGSASLSNALASSSNTATAIQGEQHHTCAGSSSRPFTTSSAAHGKGFQSVLRQPQPKAHVLNRSRLQEWEGSAFDLQLAQGLMALQPNKAVSKHDTHTLSSLIQGASSLQELQEVANELRKKARQGCTVPTFLLTLLIRRVPAVVNITRHETCSPDTLDEARQVVGELLDMASDQIPLFYSKDVSFVVYSLAKLGGLPSLPSHVREQLAGGMAALVPGPEAGPGAASADGQSLRVGSGLPAGPGSDVRGPPGARGGAARPKLKDGQLPTTPQEASHVLLSAAILDWPEISDPAFLAGWRKARGLAEGGPATLYGQLEGVVSALLGGPLSRDLPCLGLVLEAQMRRGGQVEDQTLQGKVEDLVASQAAARTADVQALVRLMMVYTTTRPTVSPPEHLLDSVVDVLGHGGAMSRLSARELSHVAQLYWASQVEDREAVRPMVAATTHHLLRLRTTGLCKTASVIARAGLKDSQLATLMGDLLRMRLAGGNIPPKDAAHLLKNITAIAQAPDTALLRSIAQIFAGNVASLDLSSCSILLVVYARVGVVEEGLVVALAGRMAQLGAPLGADPGSVGSAQEQALLAAQRALAALEKAQPGLSKKLAL